MSDRSDTNFIIKPKGSPGTLYVNSYNKASTSEGQGAAIYIDNGLQTKTTNTSFYPIIAGTHYVKVSKSGFFDVSSSQTLDSAGKNTYNFLLEPVGQNSPHSQN